MEDPVYVNLKHFLLFLGQWFNQTNLCKNTTKFVENNKLTNDYLRNALSQNESNTSCLRPCTTVSYEATFRKMSHNSRTLSSRTNEIRDWIGFGLFYENFHVTTNHEYYVTNTEALISNIGGFLGLFLGFSCLSIINWILDNVKEYFK